MKKLLSIILVAVLSFSALSVVSLIRDVPLEEKTGIVQADEIGEETVCNVYGEQETDDPAVTTTEKTENVQEPVEVTTAPAAPAEEQATEVQTAPAEVKSGKKTWKRTAGEVEETNSGSAEAEAEEIEYTPEFKEDSKYSYTVKLSDTDTVYVPGNTSITTVDENISYVNDTILVFFKENVSAFQKYNAIRSVDGKFVGYMPIVDRYQVKVGRGDIEQLQEKCVKLMQNENVLYAAGDISIKREPDAEVEPVIPDDPWYSSTSSVLSYVDGWDETDPSGSNWHLEAVQALSAWAYNDYFHEIKVGIVDSGFSIEHEDLAGKISFPKKKFEDTNREDNHGTHVTGIIGATANNNVGTTGLCWNSKFVCVDWEPDEGQRWNTDLRIYTGFINNVKAGAKVINFSLGCSSSFMSDVSGDFFKTLAMNFEAKIYSLTMSKLLKKGYDFIVVQSAGNGSSDDYAIDAFYNGTFCPINYKNAMTCAGVSKKDVIDRIIVAGSVRNNGDCDFQQASYSNGGSQVDICAPGSNIFSTVTMKKGGYSYMSGTSMAAPMVTGIVAMTWSVNPKLTGAQIRDIVCDPANTVYEARDNDSDYHPLTDNYRLINAKLSVEAAIRLSREMGDLPPESTTEPETVTQVDPGTEETTTSGNPSIDIGDEMNI
ncbi:MAG: S8 family serine peptidase [Clostridiales bacterium]|nr:S8 family serine peptidase [Clostridiales bacterium]